MKETTALLIGMFFSGLCVIGPDPGLGAPVNAEDQVELSRTVRAMGTALSLDIRADSRATAMAASERALKAVEAAERRLSTWNPDTELSKLNGLKLGEAAALSKPLQRDLELSRECGRRTEGAFHPGMGALIRAWGTRTGFRVPSDQERQDALASARSPGFEWADGQARRVSEGYLFEEGGFAKGVALDDALEALRGIPGVESAVLNFGGQVALNLNGGAPTSGRKREVPVVVADPADRGKGLFTIEVDSGSVSTSGNGVRGKKASGVTFNHILDPRNGAVARDFGSVTVWAPGAAWADCLSTALYVLGPEQALAWQRTHSDVQVLVIEPGRARASCGLKGRIRALSPTVSLEFQCESTTGKTPDEKKRRIKS